MLRSHLVAACVLLALPRGFGADGADGYYLVADSFNHRLQRCHLDSAVCSTALGGSGAGSGGDQLAGPSGITIEKRNGYSFAYVVADTYNHRIQHCRIGNSSCSTVAGFGGRGFSLNQLRSPTASAVEYSTNGEAAAYIVADTDNDRLLRCRVGSDRCSLIAFGIGGPQGVAVEYDSGGSVSAYLCTVPHGLRRCISDSGGYTCAYVAGSGAASMTDGFFAPARFVVDAGAGTAVVADKNNQRLTKEVLGATWTRASTCLLPDSPFGVTVQYDAQGVSQHYLVTGGDHSVYRVPVDLSGYTCIAGGCGAGFGSSTDRFYEPLGISMEGPVAPCTTPVSDVSLDLSGCAAVPVGDTCEAACAAGYDGQPSTLQCLITVDSLQGSMPVCLPTTTTTQTVTTRTGSTTTRTATRTTATSTVSKTSVTTTWTTTSTSVTKTTRTSSTSTVTSRTSSTSTLTSTTATTSTSTVTTRTSSTSTVTSTTATTTSTTVTTRTTSTSTVTSTTATTSTSTVTTRTTSTSTVTSTTATTSTTTVTTRTSSTSTVTSTTATSSTSTVTTRTSSTSTVTTSTVTTSTVTGSTTLLAVTQAVGASVGCPWGPDVGADCTHQAAITYGGLGAVLLLAAGLGWKCRRPRSGRRKVKLPAATTSTSVLPEASTITEWTLEKEANAEGKEVVKWSLDMDKVQLHFANDGEPADEAEELLAEAPSALAGAGLEPQASMAAGPTSAGYVAVHGFVEYFSVTHSQWVLGTVRGVESHGGSDTFAVELSSGRMRRDVAASLLRRVLKPGEPASIYIPSRGVWVEARIGPQQAVNVSLLGYRLHLQRDLDAHAAATSRRKLGMRTAPPPPKLRTVPSVLVRRRFVVGRPVELYQDASSGWVRGKVLTIEPVNLAERAGRILELTQRTPPASPQRVASVASPRSCEASPRSQGSLSYGPVPVALLPAPGCEAGEEPAAVALWELVGVELDGGSTVQVESFRLRTCREDYCDVLSEDCQARAGEAESGGLDVAESAAEVAAADACFGTDDEDIFAV